MKKPSALAVRTIAGSLILAFFSACGGGGGNGGNNDDPPPPPPALSFQTSTLADGVIDVPYNQTIRVSGGVGARTFSLTDGELPDGLALDASTGVVAGTPAGPVGTADFTISVVDSSSPPLDVAQPLSITINATSLGRNDSIATATAIGNGTISASISPSGHPNSILDADEDYYEITTTVASSITVDIDAQVNGSPLDSVIEIVNASGSVLNTCVSPLFNSPCISDDEDLGVELDSLLQIRVNGPTTFYIHVVDWGSNARPDKTYDLVISGVN